MRDAAQGGTEKLRPYGSLVNSLGLAPSHRLIVESVPTGSRVLDIGCASGYVAAELTARGSTVFGFDSDEEAATAARAHCVEVVVGDLERSEERAGLPADMDVVILGDVLEHLRDPLSVLADTRHLLAPQGRVLMSVPNIGFWTARYTLMLGRFRYADAGIFDRTHLRFFTRRSAHELVQEAGFEIEQERFAPLYFPSMQRIAALLGAAVRRRREPPSRPHVPSPPSGPLSEWWRTRLPQTLANRWPELFALQFVLTLRPARTSSQAPA